MNLTNSHALKYFVKKKQLHQMGFCCVYFTNFDKLPDFHQTISSLPKNSAVIFREYNLKKPKRQELAAKIQKICQKYHHKFIIGKDLQLAKRLRADGVHFSDHDQVISTKKLKNLIFSLSCHHLSSIKKAKNADLLFFSPIFATNSHHQALPQGLAQLKKAQSLSSKPIFALGGINIKNITKILNYCDGIGGIEIFKEN